MSLDRVYENISFKLSQAGHRYGDHVHILASPCLLTLLAQFGSPDTRQPRMNELLKTIIQQLLFAAMNTYAPRKVVQTDTRMREFHEQGQFRGVTVDSETKFVCVDVMRAGIIPSQVCYENLHAFVGPENVRQDHLVCSRQTDSKGRVTGVAIGGAKIGGPVKDTVMVIADPMGATGGTAVEVMKMYAKDFGGPPKDLWLIHCMVTPEYVRRVTKELPLAKIFAARLDRGMSSDRALQAGLGEYADEERGLNDKQYIVPGAGGIGEILNNSFV